MDKVTARSIIEYLSKAFSEKKSVNKGLLLDAAMKLSVLALDEVAVLTQMEQDIAKKKVEMLDAQEKRNVSEIEIRVESLDLFRDMKRQKALIDSIEEMIHTARLSAKLNEFV